MSRLKLGALAFDAFSGTGDATNQRSAACRVNAGPIPPGTYYVVDRESGGALGAFWDRVYDRSEWFSLYAADGKVDDETHCEAVRRGQFRLHPRRARGISLGCIVVEHIADYHHLRKILRGKAPTAIPGSQLMAYATVVVR